MKKAIKTIKRAIKKIAIKDGMEVIPTTKRKLPVEGFRSENIQEKIQRMVKFQLSMAAEEQGFDTFEEADDFDVPDAWDTDFESQWEMHFDPVEFPASGLSKFHEEKPVEKEQEVKEKIVIDEEGEKDE
jgi:hypothetical protein